MENEELNNEVSPTEPAHDADQILTQEAVQPASPPLQTPVQATVSPVQPPAQNLTQDIVQPAVSPEQYGLTESAPAVQPPVKIKTPLLVFIIAWIALIAGALGTLISALFLFTGGINMDGTFLSGFLMLLSYILLICVSFGLRRMKKWALIVYSVGMALTLISSILTGFDFFFIAVSAIVLIYLWIINKQFK